MRYLFILYLTILLFCTAYAGKGKFRSLNKKHSKTRNNQNNNQHRTINTITHHAGVALPVDDAGDLPIAHAVIDSTPSRHVKDVKEDQVMMEALNTTSQYKVKGMSNFFNSICSDDE
jgi:hypothetical protein